MKTELNTDYIIIALFIALIILCIMNLFAVLNYNELVDLYAENCLITASKQTQNFISNITWG
jgi:general stress protein CsbA